MKNERSSFKGKVKVMLSNIRPSDTHVAKPSEGEKSQEAITPEVAQQDIEKALQQFGTAGSGSDNDRGAAMVLLSLKVLKDRVDNPVVLDIIYVKNPDVISTLPSIAQEVISKISQGKITPEEAIMVLDQAITGYSTTFQVLGINPQEPQVLFFKKKN